MWLLLKKNQNFLFHTDDISQSCHMLAEQHFTIQMVAIAWLHFVAYCMVDSRWEARGLSNLDEGDNPGQTPVRRVIQEESPHQREVCACNLSIYSQDSKV